MNLLCVGMGELGGGGREEHVPISPFLDGPTGVICI